MYLLTRLQVLRPNGTSVNRFNLLRSIAVKRNYETGIKDEKSDTVEDTEQDMPTFNMENPFQREKAQCILCKYKVRPDYKNVKLLSQFVSPYTGRIYGRHITGLCAAQQRRVEEEITKSRNAGFMAYYLKQVEFLKDPKLFDPEHPLRPHRF